MIKCVQGSLRVDVVAIIGALLLTPLAAHSSERVHVQIREKSSELEIVIDRSTCARQWQFPQDYPGSRATHWNTAGKFDWEGDAVRRHDGRCFTRLEFLTAPDESAVDRTYPFILRFNDAMLVNLPHLIPESAQATTLKLDADLDKCAKTRDQSCRVSVGPTPVLPGALGYFAIGDMSWAKSGGFRVAGTAGFPEWLRTLTTSTLADTMSSGARWLGPLPRDEYSVFLLYDGSTPNVSWRGWSSGTDLFLTFSGKGWTNPQREFATIARVFASHENLHLWNSSAHQPAAGAPAWLTEGFAEYLALKFLAEQKDGSASDVAERVKGRIEGCLRSMKEGGAPTQGAGVYDCGVTTQWLWDWVDVAGLWRRVFAGENSQIYGLDDVMRAADTPAVEARLKQDIAWAAEGERGDRSSLLQAALQRRGLVISPDDRGSAYLKSLRETAISHLLSQHCHSGRYGFTSYPEKIVLDTGTGCGVMSGDRTVTQLEGSSIFESGLPGAVRRMAEKCQHGSTVWIGTSETDRIEVPCNQALAIPDPPLGVECSGGGLQCLLPASHLSSP